MDDNQGAGEQGPQQNSENQNNNNNSTSSFGSKMMGVYGKVLSGLKNEAKRLKEKASNFRIKINAPSSEGQKKFLRDLLWLGLIIIILLFIFFKFINFIIPAIIILGVIFLFRTNFVRNNPIFQFLLIIVLIGLVLYFFAPVILQDTSLVGQKTFHSISEKLTKSTAGFVESWSNFNPAKSWSDFMDKQIAYATGGYFEGQVEKGSEDTRLGIFIENIQSADPVIFEGEELTFWATLRGKSLGEVINVVMGCNSSLDDENRISENKNFQIYSYEQADYDCKYSSLSEGAAKITFWADYNFNTLGYTKAYFMGLERMRALRMQNIDPLDEYKIRDRNPTAIFTNGPLKLGIGTTFDQPIPVRPEGERLGVIGVTLENRWEGQVKKVNSLEIQTPYGIVLDECDHDVKEGSSEMCISRCKGNSNCEKDCGNYRFYELDKTSLKKIGQIEKYQTIRCSMNTFSREYILGDSPFSTRYFRVIVDYDYLATSSKTFYIKERRDLFDN